MFITFEGPEGAGKTTQIARAAGVLSATHKNVVVTREPGWGMVGNDLRNLLLHPPDGTQIGPLTELFLLLADRANHVEQWIRPALADGAVVLCDRYSDSTLAYQGYGRGLDVSHIAIANGIATSGLVPDLTIFIDIDPAIGLRRSQDQNRMEKMGLEFHRRVYQGYVRELTKRTDRRIVFVMGDNKVDIVHAEIMDAITRLVEGKPAHDDDEDA